MFVVKRHTFSSSCCYDEDHEYNEFIEFDSYSKLVREYKSGDVVYTAELFQNAKFGQDVEIYSSMMQVMDAEIADMKNSVFAKSKELYDRMNALKPENSEQLRSTRKMITELGRQKNEIMRLIGETEEATRLIAQIKELKKTEKAIISESEFGKCSHNYEIENAKARELYSIELSRIVKEFEESVKAVFGDE